MSDPTKPRTDLVPMHAFMAVAEAMTEGAGKHGAWDWATGYGRPVTELVAPALRHIAAFLRREEDEDHLGHAIASLMMAYDTLVIFPENDNRFNPETMSFHRRPLCPSKIQTDTTKKENIQARAPSDAWTVLKQNK